MSTPEYLPFSKLQQIWSPADFQKLREQATQFDALPAVQTPAQTDAEFNADMAYLRGLAAALFEHGTPAHITKIATDAGIS